MEAVQGSFERYRVIQQVAAAGDRAVYKAVDMTTGALVALKVLGAPLLASQGDRFAREAAVMAGLQHPGLVRFIDHGFTKAGEAFIAMEWLEGENLEDKLAGGALSPMPTARLALRLLEALYAIHEHGVVHRDVKPSNIFLVGGRIDDARLLDFGLARRVVEPKKITGVGLTVGTPMYIAPEQARGAADLDGRADVFSLGCVLYQCLTGEPPFSGDTAMEIALKICTGPTPRLANRPGVPSVMAGVVEAMLSRERADRPDERTAAVALVPIAAGV